MGSCLCRTQTQSRELYREPPNLKLITPPKVLLCRGATVTIKCIGIPDDIQEINWFKDGTLINTKSPGTLKLANIHMGNSGKYRCEITQSSGTKISSPEEDIAIEDQHILDNPVFKNLLQGSAIYFSTETVDFLTTILEIIPLVSSTLQRTCVLSLSNHGYRKLSIHDPLILKGRENNPHENRSLGKDETRVAVFTTKNTSDLSSWTPGDWKTKGVLTFDVKGTDQQVAILWNVAQAKDSRFFIQIRSQKSDTANQSLYEEMLEKAVWAGTESIIEKEGNGYKVSATMDNESMAHLAVQITSINKKKTKDRKKGRKNEK